MGSDLNRGFSKKEAQIVKKHLKKCLMSLAIREIQIKTTLRFPLTPIRMARVNKTNESSFW